jgi:RimJ/RimL family protein N-acetyltransferase
MESGGAFLIYDAKTQDIIGSSRFYDWNEKDKSIAIGYTFFAITHWKKGYNSAAKHLMIEHAFQFADRILFHVGSKNKRSQIAIERLGVVKIDEKEMKYHGEDEHIGFIYELTKKGWKEYLERKKEEEEKLQ